MNDENSAVWLRHVCRVLILVLAVISTVGHTHGQTQSLIEQAKKEGEAVLYTTMNVADFTIFNQALKEKYPFLNVRHVYLGSAVQVARVLQEHRAGKLQADVLGNGLEPMFLYRTQGVLARYESPEGQHIVSRAIDPEGYWSGITTDFLVTGFNTGDISRGNAPRSYDDYLNPNFKGKMAIDSNNSNALVGMINIGGEEKGVTYIKRLGQQDVRLVEGFNHIASLLAAGEFPLAIFMQVTKMDQLKRKGGPCGLGSRRADVCHPCQGRAGEECAAPRGRTLADRLLPFSGRATGTVPDWENPAAQGSEKSVRRN